MSHEQAYSLLEGYVFGTLEPDEFAVVEAHLASGCSECDSRIAELGELSVQLAGALPGHEPPAHVKEQLMARVRNEQPIPLPVHRPQARPARFAQLVALAATVIIAVLIGGFMSLRRDMNTLRGELAESRNVIADLRDDMELYEHTANLLGQPCTRTVELAGVDPNPEGVGRVFFNPMEGAGVVYIYHLPPTPGDKTYQIWVMHDGAPKSVGTFTVAADGSAMMRLNGVTEQKAAFQVTMEPRGGVDKPTGMVYLAALETAH